MEKNENKGRIKMLQKVKRQMKSVIEGVALRKKQKMLFKQEFPGRECSECGSKLQKKRS